MIIFSLLFYGFFIFSLSLMQIYIDILPQKEFEDIHALFFKFIQTGLSDNFTEVRFAATKTVFQFLAKIKTSPNFEKVRLSLIPKICFNRLYPAEVSIIFFIFLSKLQNIVLKLLFYYSSVLFNSSISLFLLSSKN